MGTTLLGDKDGKSSITQAKMIDPLHSIGIIFWCSTAIEDSQRDYASQPALKTFQLASCSLRTGFLRIGHVHCHGNKGTIIPNCCHRAD